MDYILNKPQRQIEYCLLQVIFQLCDSTPKYAFETLSALAFAASPPINLVSYSLEQSIVTSSSCIS